jgi:hypothetical protein
VALRTKTYFWGEVIVLRCVGDLVAGEETTAFRQGVEKLLSERRRVVNTSVRRHTYIKEGRVSGGPSFVAVVQSADLGQGHDSSHLCRLDRSRLGRVLPQREMRSRSMIVIQVGSEGATERASWSTIRTAMTTVCDGEVSIPESSTAWLSSPRS